MREAVEPLENTTKFLPLVNRNKTKKSCKLLKRNGGVEEGRTPDLCIANPLPIHF